MSEVDFSAGRWTIQKGYSDRKFETQQIISATANLVKLDRRTGNGINLQKGKQDILATYATESEAKAVLQKLRGCRGELEDRERKAREHFAEQVKAILKP